MMIFCLALKTVHTSHADVVVFGDSLSDSGNLFLASGAHVDMVGTPFDPLSIYSRFPTPPYFPGRATNGCVWIEDLVSQFGYPGPQPSLAGGTNYAFMGALTREDPEENIVSPFGVPDMDAQVSQYLDMNTPAPTDIFVFWGGANDFFFGQTNPAVPVTAISEQIKTLAEQGATNFIVLNLPPLGYTPSGAVAAPNILNWLSDWYNQELDGALDDLRADLGVTIYEVDVDTFFGLAMSDPGSFGFTNATEPAVETDLNPASDRFGFPEFPAIVAPTPNEYLFWDGVHPTEPAHKIIADLAYYEILASLNKQIHVILDFIDDSVAEGELSGSGPGLSAANRLNSLTSMIESAEVFIEDGMFEEAYLQLEQVRRRCDGVSLCPDFVEGDATTQLEQLTSDLMDDVLALAS
jgi:phospholipase/lecithinase/hemolysin